MNGAASDNLNGRRTSSLKSSASSSVKRAFYNNNETDQFFVTCYHLLSIKILSKHGEIKRKAFMHENDLLPSYLKRKFYSVYLLF